MILRKFSTLGALKFTNHWLFVQNYRIELSDDINCFISLALASLKVTNPKVFFCEEFVFYPKALAYIFLKKFILPLFVYNKKFGLRCKDKTKSKNAKDSIKRYNNKRI